MPSNDACQLEIKNAYDQLIRYAEDLHLTINLLNSSQHNLELAYVDTVNRLAQAVEYKDEETGHHVSRICFFSAILAQAMGLSKDHILRIYNSAAMHDVGKISIPDSILLKNGRLTNEEFDIMKTHTILGAKLLSNSKSKLLETGRIIALNHHERWDGAGYPQGLVKDETPIEGRIVGLVDVYDALRSERPYKPSFSMEKTLKIIRKSSNTHFDPTLVEAFFDTLSHFTQVDEALRQSNFNDPKALFKRVLPECDLASCASFTANAQG